MESVYKNKNKSQSGEVMLEASFILVTVLLLLMALLSISFLFYQKSVMNSVAMEIASDVAKNYKYTEMEIGKQEIELSDVTSTKMFRMSFAKNSIENAHEDRAENYAEPRVNLTSLGINKENLDVDCEITSSSIGRAYVKVTVSQKTDYFLSGILDMMGIADEEVAFKATAYAECTDFMGYTSMVNFTEYAAEKLSIFNSVGHLYDSIKNFSEKLVD